jgi:hypothetical protein
MTQCTDTRGAEYDAIISTTAAKHIAPERRQFSERFSERIPAQGVAIYALPTRLIESLKSNAPGWLTDDDLAFEEELADLCQRFRAVGVTAGHLVCYDWLGLPGHGDNGPLTMSLFKWLGWDQFWTWEQANNLLRMGADRTDPLRQQLQAFLGWLITNPVFLREAAELRAKEKARIDAGKPIEDNEDLVRGFAKFCAAWSLDGLATWDLPIPQGVNLSGLGTQLGIREESIDLSLPATLRLPARYPLSELLKELREHAASDRLAGWCDVLDQSGGDCKGLRRYRQMLPLHFYRNIVLESRYRDRIPGCVERLDLAFAQVLDLGEDSVKKLRLAIRQRLRDE